MQLALCSSYCCLIGQAHVLACVHPFHSELAERREKNNMNFHLMIKKKELNIRTRKQYFKILEDDEDMDGGVLFFFPFFSLEREK